MTNKEIGVHVAAFMRERGWDDKQMAEYCETIPCRVRDTIRGNCRSRQVLARIARKVGLDVPGLTSPGRRVLPKKPAQPNRLRDMVEARGYTWQDVVEELGLGHTSALHGIGEKRPVPPSMLETFEFFTGLPHKDLLELSLSLCKCDHGRRTYAGRYAAHYGCYPDGTPAIGKDRSKQGIRIPATIVGIEQEMDRLREEAPADETPEQRMKRIEHLDALWRARRDLRAKAMENAV